VTGRARLPGRRPLVSWHRGGAELAPFATLAAFSEAAASGAELIEVDVRRTGDGTLVCVHDAALPGVGRIDELDWSSAAPRFEAGDRVITFERFLAELDAQDPQRRSRVHLDLKAPGCGPEALALVAEHGRAVTATSSLAETVAAVRRSHPSVPALLTIGGSRDACSRRELARVRSSELFPFRSIEACGATGVAAHYLLATPLLRSWCRMRGLQLLVWTVDEDAALRRWLGRGDVDVVTTNRPLAAMRLRDEATTG
jgi:glycerophosphoryl diester phosphodiesterase